MIGRYMMRHLAARGIQPVGLVRSPPAGEDGWIAGDVRTPQAWAAQMPPCDLVLATAELHLVVPAIETFAHNGVRRLVAISTTSLLTKRDSVIDAERDKLARIAAAETQLAADCERLGIGWTILRPTLIYDEGRDINVSRLANLIRRFGFIPLAGSGKGLRQPVHAEDLATGAIDAAHSAAAINKAYVVPGGDTLSYRDMVGRIFEGLGRRRMIVAVPASLWRLAFRLAQPLFPHANFAMGDRMSMDMVFDAGPAQRDFGWRPRGFRPRFPETMKP